jgi:trehalose synthase
MATGSIAPVSADGTFSLSDYGSMASLSGPVAELRREAEQYRERLDGRRVLMLNSTARGGGVAEMMPRLVSILTELGVRTEWWTMNTDEPRFFTLTKRLHNLIHGSGDPHLDRDDVAVYEAVSDGVAAALRRELGSDDLLVVHDPQPAGAGARIARQGTRAVWRCHIGLDEDTAQTDAAWSFLEPHLSAYDHSVFTAPEYIPSYLSSTVSIIPPALDPFSYKNRELAIHEVVGVLCNAGLSKCPFEMVTPPFEQQAERLQADGTWGPATEPEDIAILYRPLVTQISRWDRLKGWRGLLDGFLHLKRSADKLHNGDPRHSRRLNLVRLVLAGPEPAAVQDDPEAKEVLEELIGVYRELDPELQEVVAILSLPMASRKHNALMVNALQRCSSVVVQNSLQEGFGLTATEAMWKRARVIGTHACGLRQQIRHGIDGLLVKDPTNAEEVAAALDQMLSLSEGRGPMVTSAQRRVYDEFLVFRQVRRWLRVLAEVSEGP